MITMTLRIDGKPSIQQNEEQAIAVCELDATVDLSLQHDQLMSERGTPPQVGSST
jgi:hypothetical protein